MNNKPIPQCPEMEMAIIGTMLMSSDEVDKITHILKHGCTEDLFFTSTLRNLFKLITDEYREGRIIDKLQLATRIYNDPNKTLGDASDLMHCEGLELPTARIESAMATLQEFKARRDIITYTNRLNTKAYDVNEPMNELRSSLNEGVDAISSGSTVDEDGVSVGEAFNGLIDMWTQAKSNGGMRGITTGINNLDHEIKGLGKGDLVCFTGKPSMGKSVLILQSLVPTILAKGKVLIFTMEMTSEEVIARLVANMASVEMSMALTGFQATKKDLKRIEDAAKILKDADITIYDKGDQSISYIEAKSLSSMYKGYVDAVAIDYWQLIESPDHKDELKRLNYTSRRLKTLAKLLKSVVITGSQLNEDNKTKDSKAMIADANILVRVEEEGLIVDKSRNSARSQFIPCRLNGKYQRFE